ELLELLRRPADHAGVRRQRLRGGRDLLLGFRPVFLLDRLAHAGEGLDPVASIEPGRVDLVTVPGAAGEARAAQECPVALAQRGVQRLDRKSTRLNSSHQIISYAVFC